MVDIAGKPFTQLVNLNIKDSLTVAGAPVTGESIYSIDGSLTGNRTVTLNSFTLTFEDAAGSGTGASASLLASFHNTDTSDNSVATLALSVGTSGDDGLRAFIQGQRDGSGNGGKLHLGTITSATVIARALTINSEQQVVIGAEDTNVEFEVQREQVGARRRASRRDDSVLAGNGIGRVQFGASQESDGTGASITVEAEVAWSAGDTNARIKFQNASNGNDALTTNGLISAGGNWGFGRFADGLVNTPVSKVQVYTNSSGTGPASGYAMQLDNENTTVGASESLGFRLGGELRAGVQGIRLAGDAGQVVLVYVDATGTPQTGLSIDETGATFDGNIDASGLPSGANQGASGATTGQLWVDTANGEVIKRGV